jgi:iron-sulfur cluster assembly accessory protein
MDTATATSPAETKAPTDKPVLTLTATAVAQVREVMKQQGYDGYTLTVRVIPAGCSGLGYDLNLMREGKPGDILWEQDGVKIATDPMSVKYLAGTCIDYQVTDTAAGFKFDNPNAKSGCGCGSSFSV